MKACAFVRTACAVLSLLPAFAPSFAYAQQDSKSNEQTKPSKTGEKTEQKEDAVTALKQLLKEHPELLTRLKDLIEQIEKEKGGVPAQPQKPGEEPPIPDIQIPGEKAPAQPAQAQPGIPPIPTTGAPTTGSVRASLTPDISVIGNHIGRFISVHGDPDRNRFQLNEIEVGFQQPIYPGIRFDAFLNAGSDDGFKAGFEEAYATLSQIGHLPFGGLIGKKRLDFGKINPVHPHARPYADQPDALRNLLDPDSLNGNGASLFYLFPFKNFFANLEVGLWQIKPTDAGMSLGEAPNTTFYPAGLGINNNFPMARLWTSKDLGGKAGELELGGSFGYGRADIGDDINLSGLDLTYRNFPGTFKKLLLQSEVFWHHRHDNVMGTGGHTRSGHYALLAYDPDQYTELGLRYDNSKYPWPLPGRDQSVSLIWTNRLTEVTILRLQYKYGDRTSDVFLPAQHGYSELYLQFIWGGGSHTHPLQ